MEGEKLDRWGYPVRSNSDGCISSINSYYHQVLTYGRKRAVIMEAAAEDPNCVLANVFAAYFLSSNNPSLASTHLASATSRLDQATSYEKAVFNAVSSLMAENRDDDVALESHFNLLKEFPRDLVSLKRAQMLCFYLGRPDLSLQLVEQVLPQNQNESYIYGMLAFPLLELARMDDAEKAARKGLDINKQDLWSQHCVSQIRFDSWKPFGEAVVIFASNCYLPVSSLILSALLLLDFAQGTKLCHVLQNDCLFKEAVEFMEACVDAKEISRYTHNWWHVAVCYLEGCSPLDKVLEVYDCHIWNELQRSDADCGEVYLNALGLLLRVCVRGQRGFIENRLKFLATCLMNEAIWHKEWLLDLLALWALSSSKETHKAEDLLKSMKSRINSMTEKKRQSMQRGTLLAEALYEYGRENYERAFEVLGPDFDACDFKMVGASDEQLDVFNEVWYSILLNTGHFSKAIEVIEKQIKKREGAPFLWQLLGPSSLVPIPGGVDEAYRDNIDYKERAYSIAGRDDASVVAERAKALERAYFEQMV